MKSSLLRFLFVRVLCISLVILTGCSTGGDGGRGTGTETSATPTGSNSIVVSATPDGLPADGSSTSTIIATVTCANGDAAADGEVISFSIPSGAGTLSASTAETTGGVATVTYTAPSSVPQDGIALIAAESADGQIYTAISITLTGLETIDIQPRLALIEIAEGSPDPASIDVKGTGGQSTSLITFDVKDSRGNHVTDGYRIDFYIDSSPNGGEDILPTSALTTDGQVSTILRSGFKSGPVGIKAVYHHDTNISTTTCQVAINAGPPVGEEFGIFAEYVNMSGLYDANLEDVISVNAGDIYGNAIPDKTSISFKTYNTGGFFEPGSAATLNGLASNNLHSSGTYLQPLEGFVSVTGETNNGGRTTHVTCLAVTPATTNVIYAGTDGGGVYKSTDSGATWTNISRSSTIQGQNWLDPYVNDIDVDPDDPNVVYAATGYLGRGNVYRSLDGGNTWNSDNTEEWNGVLSTAAVVLTVLCDDNSDYVWVGTEGLGAIYATDGKDFRTSGIGHGRTVLDIVKVPGASGAFAVLYAATRTGVFKSTDGGQTWAEPGSFSGDYINCLALHPLSNGTTDIIYAGTEAAGVWVSMDSGGTWAAWNSGMGKGLSATTPVADPANKGNGVMSEVTVDDDTLSESWTVTCTAAAAEGGTFSVVGSVSKEQPNATEGTPYTSNNSMVSFTISDGTSDFEVNDSFRFTTTKDTAGTIKDLLVDHGNERLYAITYFWGPLEPHAVGNLYVHGLNADGSMTAGAWEEATIGLPEFDPPDADDTTLFAQHVMAPDIAGTPNALYIGGEGINLYKATTGLTSGSPAWNESKTGLTNLIMARMPILFSGRCHMTITQEPGESDVTYTVYIQDENGNPPIAGSAFKVTKTDVKAVVLQDVVYPDVVTYPGTWRDPSDPGTNNPYIIRTGVARTNEETPVTVEFVFTPTCGASAPGCSGSLQAVQFEY